MHFNILREIYHRVSWFLKAFLLHLEIYGSSFLEFSSKKWVSVTVERKNNVFCELRIKMCHRAGIVTTNQAKDFVGLWYKKKGQFILSRTTKTQFWGPAGPNFILSGQPNGPKSTSGYPIHGQTYIGVSVALLSLSTN